jgi:hypothetical protein
MVLSPSTSGMLPAWLASWRSSSESFTDTTVVCLESCEAFETLEAGVDARLDAADLPITVFFGRRRDLLVVFFAVPETFFLDLFVIIYD